MSRFIDSFDITMGRGTSSYERLLKSGSTIDVFRTIELYVRLQETLRGRDSCSCGHVQDWREPTLKLADGATNLSSLGVHCREVAACWNTSALESHQVRHLADRLGAHQMTKG